MGVWLARLPWEWMFWSRPPARLVRWLLVDSDELVGAVRGAVGVVSPGVLAGRLRMALRAEPVSAGGRVPVLFLNARRDRLLHRQRAGAVVVDGPHLLLQCVPELVVRVLVEHGVLG